MDYLLRDSHHTGVAYGRFDHYRLIDTLRILAMPTAAGTEELGEPALGMEKGGLESAEALMLARYFMYSQVYFHAVRRIYDIHLMDFLKEWLDGGVFATDLDTHLKMTDNEVTASLASAATDAATPAASIHARRIIERQHFKVVYERNPEDVLKNPEAGRAVFDGLAREFGADSVRSEHYQQRSGPPDFPVRIRDDIVSSLAVSETLNGLPVVSMDYVYAERSTYARARKWLQEHRADVIQPKKEADGG